MQLGFAGAIAELEREHRSWLDRSAKKKFKNDWQERMALAPLTTCQKKNQNDPITVACALEDAG